MFDSLKNVAFLIDKKFTFKFILLFCLSILSSLLEIIGLAIFIPLFNILQKNENINNTFFFLTKNINLQSINEILIYIFLIFGCKYLILTIHTLYNNYILANAKSSICKKIFSHYISKNYTFHIKRNSSELFKNTFIETGYFINNILRPLLKILTDLILLIFIFFFLALYNFKVTIISFFLLLFFSYIFFKFYKNITINLSQKRIFHDNHRLKFLTEGLKAIKEINIYSLEKFFINRMNFHNHRATMSASYEMNLLQIPKLFLEFLIIIIFILLIYFNANDNSQNPILIENIVIFGACITRLMPTINSLTASFQSIRFHHNSIDILFNEIKDRSYENLIEEKPKEILEFKKSIKLEDISFSFNGKKIFENLNMIIQKGEVIGIKGESGSGKSSLINILLGLLDLDKGNMLVDDKTLNKETKKYWKNNFAYIPHNCFIIDDTIKNNIIFGEENFNYDLLNWAIKRSELSEIVSEKNQNYDYEVGENGLYFSTGQIQRIGIARGIYKSKKIILLDEATNALDVDTETKILSNLVKYKDKTTTVVIISHRSNNYKLCDRVYEIKDKKLIGG
jgi:ABC-type multidrug transport system fused ATPase/permease subunit